MRKVFWGFSGLLLAAIGVMAAILIFDAPVKPQPLKSISDPFAAVDFRDLAPPQAYSARDGAQLSYRAYPGAGLQVAVLIHGSSDDGTGLHALAKALRDDGFSVYVPSQRGHRNSGRSGDIDHAGQLEEDLADFVASLRPRHDGASMSLIGFSSGGGFVLRTIGSANEKLFDRFIMISPALPPGSPTIRPGVGGWVSLAMPRIVVLTMLNRIGIDWFNGLPIIAFATSPKVTNLTSTYSYRLTFDFAAPRDYLAALGRSKKPAALLVGGADELFYADRYAPLLMPVRPDLRITVVPGVGHIGMTVSPEGIAAVRASLRELMASGAS